jgi:hypothetical protein
VGLRVSLNATHSETPIATGVSSTAQGERTTGLNATHSETTIATSDGGLSETLKDIKSQCHTQRNTDCNSSTAREDGSLRRRLNATHSETPIATPAQRACPAQPQVSMPHTAKHRLQQRIADIEYEAQKLRQPPQCKGVFKPWRKARVNMRPDLDLRNETYDQGKAQERTPGCFSSPGPCNQSIKRGANGSTTVCSGLAGLDLCRGDAERQYKGA